MTELGTTWGVQRLASGQWFVGYGECVSSAVCPTEGSAFYVNDYSLRDPAPWKRFSECLVVDDLRELLADGGEGEGLEVEWQETEVEAFAAVFGEIQEAIAAGELVKSVPVMAQLGHLVSGGAQTLLAAMQRALEAESLPLLGYAWSDDESGHCGLTPEVLFRLRKGRLTTMALAGTANAEEKEVFAFDQKEIREHEFVAQTLVSKLSEIGMVRCEKREILDLGALVHFYTPMEVFLYGGYDYQKLVEHLHPTPALGPLPRTQQTLEQLNAWRESLGCPQWFGAPFGCYHEGVLQVLVAIRGLGWQEGGQVVLPVGCGVIEESSLINEWRELGLKRLAVKRLFGLM